MQLLKELYKNALYLFICSKEFQYEQNDYKKNTIDFKKK